MTRRAAAADTAADEFDEGSRVVARPDGYYWVADDGRQEFGPYATAQAALLALRAGIDTGLEPADTLADAEAEAGFVEEPVRDDDAVDQ